MKFLHLVREPHDGFLLSAGLFADFDSAGFGNIYDGFDADNRTEQGDGHGKATALFQVHEVVDHEPLLNVPALPVEESKRFFRGLALRAESFRVVEELALSDGPCLCVVDIDVDPEVLFDLLGGGESGIVGARDARGQTDVQNIRVAF